VAIEEWREFSFFINWKINWIFENQDICIALLHGFNGTTNLWLEHWCLCTVQQNSRGVNWRINWIFENQDICISFLHGFNGTSNLWLEPFCVYTYIGFYICQYQMTFLCPWRRFQWGTVIGLMFCGGIQLHITQKKIDKR